MRFIINLTNIDWRSILIILICINHGFQLILTLACLYIMFANQQINIILNFVSIIILLFLNFFSINDIYLLSFFIGLVYSGALLVTFVIVVMISDVHSFNVRNNVSFL